MGYEYDPGLAPTPEDMENMPGNIEVHPECGEVAIPGEVQRISVRTAVPVNVGITPTEPDMENMAGVNPK